MIQAGPTLKIAPHMMLPADLVTSTLLVLGGKGMGKTNLGSVLAEELSATGLHFAIIDPLGVWHGLMHSANGRGPGIPVLILGGIHGHMPIEPTGGAVVADLVADEEVDVVVDVSRRADGRMWSLGERIRFVTDFATRLYERQGERRRPVHLLIDEAARFVPQQIPHGSPDLAKCCGALERLVEEGRNVGIGVTLITQRSARINKSVAELADCMIAFRTVGPRSIDAIMDWFGEHVPKERVKELIERLRQIPRGTALVVSPGWLRYEGEVAIRLRTTFDSSATPEPGKAERRASGRGAEIDAGRFAERMAATIEKAKADDPRALRAKVADLEKRLATEVMARRDAPPAAPVVVEVVPMALVGQAKNVSDLRAAMGDVNERVGSLLEMIEGVIRTGATKSDARRLVKVRPVASAQAAAPVRELRPGRGDVRMGAGMAAILTAIVQHADGVPREQLTVLTGYKKSTRDAYIQRLQAAAFVVQTNGALVGTGAGRAALGPDFAPLPIGDALREHWMGELPDGERAVFAAVVKEYPNCASREVIGTATGYKKSTRDAYLQRLAARRLIAIVGHVEVRASDALFG